MPDYIPPPDATTGYIPPPDINAPMGRQGAEDIIKSGSGVAAPSIPLTPGQRTYRMARPFIAPVVETAGMVGGGVVGGTGGATLGGVGAIPGAVAGAGLGYGMAKSGMRAADQYLGGYEGPTSFGSAAWDAAKDVTEGAAMEVASPYIAKGVGYLAGGAKDAGTMAWNAVKGQAGQLAERRAAKIAQEAAAGSKIGNVGDFLSALAGRKAGQTGAQATAELQSPTLQALLERAGLRDPGAMLQIEGLQAKESGNALRTLAPWETQTQGRQATEMLQKALKDRTAPMREQAIEMANLGQVVADLESKAAELGAGATEAVANVRKLVDAGHTADAISQLRAISDQYKFKLPAEFPLYRHIDATPTTASHAWDLGTLAETKANESAASSLDLGQARRYAEAAAKKMREMGIAPLETAPLIRGINEISSSPRYAGNDLISGAANALSRDLQQWTNSGGIIDAAALDAIRKNSVDAVIAKLRPGMDATTQQKLASKVLSEIKPLIDSAIEGAGGAGWKNYLSEYSSGMQDIAKTKLKGEALRLWETNKKGFMDLVNGNSPEVVEQILGPGQYDIAKALTQREMDILGSESAKIKTNEAVKSQAAMGQDALAELLKRNMWKAKIPFLLNWKTSAANVILGKAEEGLGKKVMDQLTEAAADPAKLEALLSRVPPSARSTILNAMKSGNMRLGVNQVAPAVYAGTNAESPNDGRQ